MAWASPAPRAHIDPIRVLLSRDGSPQICPDRDREDAAESPWTLLAESGSVLAATRPNEPKIALESGWIWRANPNFVFFPELQNQSQYLN